MNNYGFQSEPENSFHENYNLYHDKRSQSFADRRICIGTHRCSDSILCIYESDLRTACHYFRSVVQRRGK